MTQNSELRERVSEVMAVDEDVVNEPSEYLEKEVIVKTEPFVSDINEGERLGFAKMILLFLFVLVVLVFAGSFYFTYLSPDNEKLSTVINTAIDFTKTAVPSIATLVLGFYFGRKD